jgi:tryptophanyl-tRNA synthetase
MDRLLTGLQPSGSLTIGNFSGGIKQVIDYQSRYETFLFVPDMHATTVTQDPDALHKNIISAVGVYLASGVDVSLENMHLYIQSENLYHANLSWILECHAYYGELSRMHQFKEKSKLHENFTCGLFTYPVLMASDILLYDAKYVPTGIDQKQHVELARDLALRFNRRYGEDYFVTPEPLIPTVGAKIRDLQDPTKKMSKSSENPKASLFLLDNEKDIRKKIMSAVTDSDGRIAFDEENKPGVSNLMTIYRAFTGKTFEEIEREFEGKGYGDFKLAVGEVCADALEGVQAEFKRLAADKKFLEEIMAKGAREAYGASLRTMSKVRRKVGFTECPRF